MNLLTTNESYMIVIIAIESLAAIEAEDARDFQTHIDSLV